MANTSALINNELTRVPICFDQSFDNYRHRSSPQPRDDVRIALYHQLCHKRHIAGNPSNPS
jgi:hypothetical protein